MAKENGELTAAEKGKGKMKDDKPVNGEIAPGDSKKDKDGKPIVNGKKGESQEGSACTYATDTC